MKKLIFILMLVCLTTSVIAFSENDIEITAIRDNIIMGKDAQFLITIDSNQSNIFEVRMYSPDVEWTIPQTTIKVYPYQESTEKLVINPTKYIKPGMHGIKLNFKRTDTEELVSKIIFVNVRPPGEAVSSYVPSVNMEVGIADEAVPGEDFVISVVLENQNLLVLEDLVLRVRSNLEVLNSDQEVSLGPVTGDKGSKALELTYEISYLQKPGSYQASFELLRDNVVIEKSDSKKITIFDSTPAYKEETETSSRFLKTTSIITFTSQSNKDDEKTIKIRSGLLKRLFTDTSEGSRVIEEDGKKYVAFDLALDIGESEKVYVTTSYRIPLLILIIVIIGIISYLKYKSPVKIRKGISDLRIKEGGISELRVMLDIKNLSDRKIKNLAVVDYVPNIADVSKGTIEGTLKPSKMLMHKKKGTILKWEIPELAAGEERLISYEMMSKLSIVGNFRLPRAKIILKRNKKEIHSYSNSVGVNA